MFLTPFLALAGRPSAAASFLLPGFLRLFHDDDHLVFLAIDICQGEAGDTRAQALEDYTSAAGEARNTDDLLVRNENRLDRTSGIHQQAAEAPLGDDDRIDAHRHGNLG